MSHDIVVWWISYIVVAGVAPLLVLAYIAGPRRKRITRTRDVIQKAQLALNAAPGEQTAATEKNVSVNAALRQSIAETTRLIEDLYGARNYILPITALTLVVGVGFFLYFSTAYPLYQFDELDDLLMNIPRPLFDGFLGAFFFALYSLVSRYRISDIPVFLLRLAYQIVLGSAIGSFVGSALPSAAEAPGAFAAAFIPYPHLITWIRRQGAARLSINQQSSSDERRSTRLEDIEGLAADHRERLAEEDIYAVQNLAIANPLHLYLATGYPMSLIIDWIDQAYLTLC